jgi:cbb3-type cytochrome oxidase cytochrome c subunit
MNTPVLKRLLHEQCFIHICGVLWRPYELLWMKIQLMVSSDQAYLKPKSVLDMEPPEIKVYNGLECASREAYVRSNCVCVRSML